MTKIAMTDVSIRSLAPPQSGQRCYWDSKFPTFGVRVSQGGSKTFVLNQRKSLLTIGRFGVLSLSEARIEAKRLLAERTLGKVRPASISFESALAEFLEDKGKTRRPRTVDNLRDRLRIHFPFKDRLSDITHGDVMRRLKMTETNAEHDHALSVAKTFFTWAHNRRYIDDNPTRGIEMRGSQSRDRVLSDEELKAIWQASGQCGTFGDIVRVLIFTGLRRSECAALRSQHIADDRITLPRTLTKNGREHILPLTPTLKSLLPDSDGLLFPARGRSVPFNGWSKGKSAIDKSRGMDTGYDCP